METASSGGTPLCPLHAGTDGTPQPSRRRTQADIRAPIPSALAAPGPNATQRAPSLLAQVGARLNLADAGLGLRVGDLEAGAVRVVEADLSDPQVAHLADAYAGVPEGGDECAVAEIGVRLHV
jgi:hypothetical protein